MKSRTIKFMLFMAALESTVAGLHYLQPFLSVDQFALISFGLGLLTTVGGVYMRTITTEPLSEK